MQFDLSIFLMDQFVLMFITLTIGMAVGKILKLDTSGTLFVGLGLGWWIKKYAENIILNPQSEAKVVKAAEKLISVSVVDDLFFTLFLIFFVATVGLLTADKIAIVLKKYGCKFVLLGFIITAVGAAGTYGMTYFMKGVNPYEIMGVYSGALTSSPGLAAAIETTKSQSMEVIENYENDTLKEKQDILEDIGVKLESKDVLKLTAEQKLKYRTMAEAGVGTGYAVAYPWGVIIVIIMMQIIPKVFRIDLDKEYEKFNNEMRVDEVEHKKIKTVNFNLVSFGSVCVFGYFIGMAKIYMGESLGWFSLSATGGVLIAALILGYIGKVGGLCFRMDKVILGEVRDLGLSMFLGVVGLRYGFAAVESLTGSGLMLSISAILVGVLAITVGYLVGRFVLGINWIMLSGAICGGMTSTPGLGAAISSAGGKDDPAAGYGATYPFALFGMVLFTIIMNKLPIL